MPTAKRTQPAKPSGPVTRSGRHYHMVIPYETKYYLRRIDRATGEVRDVDLTNLEFGSIEDHLADLRGPNGMNLRHGLRCVEALRENAAQAKSSYREYRWAVVRAAWHKATKAAVVALRALFWRVPRKTKEAKPEA
jgi:hypothetical protein